VAAALLAVLAVVATGCASEGDDDLSSDAAEDEQDAGPAPTPDGDDGGDGGEDDLGSLPEDGRTEAELADDTAAAEAVLLTVDDLPAGWSAGAPDDEEEDEELQAALAECLGVDPELLDPDNPQAKTPDFTSPDGGDQVTADVTFTPSAAHAGTAFDILGRDETPRCYAEALQTATAQAVEDGEMPPGVEFGEPTFEELSFPDLGDESTAFRITIPVAAQGTEIELYGDVALVRVGRVGIEATFLTELRPFDTEEAAELVQVMIDRVPPDA
jgi:hypothetical protein